MFTPPPSPLPRKHDIEHPLDAADLSHDDRVPDLLLPLPVSSPSSPSRPQSTPPHDPHATEKRPQSHSVPIIDLPHPPSSKPQSLPSPGRSKKTKGRCILAAVVLAPLLLVCVTVAYHRCMPQRVGSSLAHPSDERLDVLDALGLSWVTGDRRLKRQASESGSLVPTSTPTGPVPVASQAVPLVPPTTPPPPIPNPFPQPFDVSLSANFSSASCQTFFTNFTQDLSFRACRSFGLLLDSSNAFFMAETNLTTMNNIVWGTCNTRPSADDCVTSMSELADTLREECADDLAAENVVVGNALTGFGSYGMYRQAGCLIDEQTSSYCYLQALAATSPSDAYFYSLGLGISLPNGTTPSCSPCVQKLMAIYAGTAEDSMLPITRTYASAQNATAATCGEGYATPINVSNENAAYAMRPAWMAIAGAALLAATLL